ncbi:ABC transporter permease [Mycolicibacterium neoaurum]|uniref:ABC transporter permease n=1 Tax=Mycolicibacterium neoaurum TaxID=1795 RepID=UPI0026721050|nr:ABC transporter permease [Mycolicibacterium neoaurum]MDO3399913.1 ABC transporter permease [Mycolicibacterium neoaurum]
MVRRAVWGGSAVVVLLASAAFAGAALWPYGPLEQDYGAILQPPNPTHWLGTTRLGEDVLAQVLAGLRTSILVGLAVAVLSTAVAAVLGCVAGLRGGALDAGVIWLADAMLVFPPVLLVALMSPAFEGRSWLLVVGAIAAIHWMLPTRMVRARSRVLRDRGFVRAAVVAGAGPTHIVRRHLLPHLGALLAIDATLTVGTAVLAEAGLSYFGLGIRPPDLSLGTLIAAGAPSALTYGWLFLAPAAALVLLVGAVAAIGEGIRAMTAEPVG